MFIFHSIIVQISNGKHFFNTIELRFHFIEEDGLRTFHTQIIQFLISLKFHTEVDEHKIGHNEFFHNFLSRTFRDFGSQKNEVLALCLMGKQEKI